jgi:hypothetical protein
MFRARFATHLIKFLLLGSCAFTVGAVQAGDILFRSGMESGAWIDVSGTSFWQCSANCSVQSGQFVESGAGMTITATGNWNVNLRPLAIRVDATTSPMFQLGVGRLAGGNDFGVCANYVANTSCFIDVSADIQRLNLYISGTIRKIELYILQ